MRRIKNYREKIICDFKVDDLLGRDCVSFDKKAELQQIKNLLPSLTGDFLLYFQ